MSDLADFLLARYAEDEALAVAADAAPQYAAEMEMSEAEWQLHERFSPAWVLAECEAKRRIVAIHRADVYAFETVVYAGDMLADSPVIAGAVRTLRLLALPYADHPDYQLEWRP